MKGVFLFCTQYQEFADHRCRVRVMYNLIYLLLPETDLKLCLGIFSVKRLKFNSRARSVEGEILIYLTRELSQCSNLSNFVVARITCVRVSTAFITITLHLTLNFSLHVPLTQCSKVWGIRRL